MATPMSDMPSFNSPDWKGTIQCLGVDDTGKAKRYGCGTGFHIHRDDLFSLSGYGMSGSTYDVLFHCPNCGVETRHPHSSHFKGLLTREEWLAAHPEPATDPDLARVKERERF